MSAENLPAGDQRRCNDEVSAGIPNSRDVDPTESQVLTDETVVIDGDTAVVFGTDTVHGTENGAVYTQTLRYTVTSIRRHGRWLALAEPLVKAPATAGQ
jgi:hypothetical protein